MKYKFTEAEAFKFGWNGLDGLAYSSKDDFDFASTAVFNVTKSHGKCKSTLCNRVYYVIEGQGKFIIAGKDIEVSASDVVIVPKNTEYDYVGKMKLFLVHTPAYDASCEVG
ncbi:MAG: hypothetical protein FWG80_02075 [Alphaproteobacteria bacterium]|nr:hypothetical protein [Alphaproteobacteria bacterium]